MVEARWLVFCVVEDEVEVVCLEVVMALVMKVVKAKVMMLAVVREDSQTVFCASSCKVVAVMEVVKVETSEAELP